MNFSYFMPRKTPSTATAVPLPQEGGLGDFTHKMTYYAVGVCDLKFNITNIEFGCRHCRPSLRQQIYNASVVERSDLMKGSLREGAPDGVGWRSTRAV